MKAAAISKIFANSTKSSSVMGDSAGVGIAYFDLQGAVIKSNKEFQTLISAENSINNSHNFRNLFQFSFENESATNMFWYKVLDGLPQSTEVRVPHKGITRRLKVFLTSVTDSQAFVSGIIGFFSQSDSIFSSIDFQESEKLIHDPYADFGWKEGRSKKIIIAADLNGYAEVLKEALHTIGYEFIAISNSVSDMVDKCSIINPDWVFVDYLLKNGQDGIELAKTLKNSGVESIVFTSVLFEDVGISTLYLKNLKTEELKRLDAFLMNSE